MAFFVTSLCFIANCSYATVSVNHFWMDEKLLEAYRYLGAFGVDLSLQVRNLSM